MDWELKLMLFTLIVFSAGALWMLMTVWLFAGIFARLIQYLPTGTGDVSNIRGRQ